MRGLIECVIRPAATNPGADVSRSNITKVHIITLRAENRNIKEYTIQHCEMYMLHSQSIVIGFIIGY